MKIFTVAMVATMLASIAVPANAFQREGRPPEEKKADPRQTKAEDSAYKAALDRIPASKEKYDPWGVARPADSAKKPK